MNEPHTIIIFRENTNKYRTSTNRELNIKLLLHNNLKHISLIYNNKTPLIKKNSKRAFPPYRGRIIMRYVNGGNVTLVFSL